jgi:hypothetical protein
VALDPSSGQLPEDMLLVALADELGDQKKTLKSHGQHLDAIETAVANIGDDVKKLVKRASGTPAVVCWPDLDDVGTQEAWAALLKWVAEVLLPDYPHVTTPGNSRLVSPCWYRHPMAVRELSALHHAWCYAYRDSDAPVTAANDWQKRLAEASARVGAQVKCANGHNDDRPTGDPVDEGFTAFVSADISSRPVRPVSPPQP